MAAHLPSLSSASSSTSLLCLSLSLLPRATPLTVAVIGAHGRLGREVVWQALDRKWNVIAGTRRPDEEIEMPSRVGKQRQGKDGHLHHISSPLRVPNRTRRLIRDARLTHAFPHEIQTYYEYDALLFVHGSRHLDRTDTTDVVVRQVCSELPDSCRSVGMVSFVGMEEAVSNLRSNSWLLDKYASKWNQEMTMREVSSKGFRTRIWREMSLSDSTESSSVSTSRRELAKRMLDWVMDDLIDHRT